MCVALTAQKLTMAFWFHQTQLFYYPQINTKLVYKGMSGFHIPKQCSLFATKYKYKADLLRLMWMGEEQGEFNEVIFLFKVKHILNSCIFLNNYHQQI